MKTMLVAGGGAVAFILILIGAVLVFGKPKEGKKPNYGRLATLCVTVVGIAGAGAYYVCGQNNEKRAKRDAAFEALGQRFRGLRSARRTEIGGDCVGTIPWFMSEEWIHAYGLASGKYQNEEIIVVECTHVIDPILVTTDSKIMQGLSGVVSHKHQRLYLRAMEATVFAEPLENVTDLVFVPQMDASRAYYKRALGGQDCDLANVFKLPRRLRQKYWMAAAAPDECDGLFATDLPVLLHNRKWCIVQVVGGHCVVMTSQWHGNHPGKAPGTEEAITENLDFAHAVYRELRRFNDGEASVQSTTFASEQTSPDAMDAADVPSATPAPSPEERTVMKKHGSRRPHSLLAKFLLFGIGLPLFLIGVLAVLGMWIGLHQGRAAHNWPQVEAVILTSRVDANNSGRMAPMVCYQYTVDGKKYSNDCIQQGPTRRTRDKREVERELARYPVGAVVKAHYHPRRPGTSVLVPGVKDESTVLGVMIFTGSIAAAGLLMCVYGAAGKKNRPQV
jgi:hypothetical protein